VFASNTLVSYCSAPSLFHAKNVVCNSKYDINWHDSGYTIPEGWAVMVCPPAVHLSPEKYEDPLAFNPWRWEVGFTWEFLILNHLRYFNTKRSYRPSSHHLFPIIINLLCHQGIGIKRCIKKIHGFWWRHEILCWNRVYQGADGCISTLPGHKVQVIAYDPFHAWMSNWMSFYDCSLQERKRVHLCVHACARERETETD